MNEADRARALIEKLGLAAHPEGGWYTEIYRSPHRVRWVNDAGGERALGAGAVGGAERAALTTIYFLLARGEHSRWHRLAAEELWHFLEGDPLELHVFDPAAGALRTHILGPHGEVAAPVAVVPAGCWQAARPTGAYTLIGATVVPGFEFEDFALVSDLDGHAPAFEGPLAALRELL